MMIKNAVVALDEVNQNLGLAFGAALTMLVAVLYAFFFKVDVE